MFPHLSLLSLLLKDETNKIPRIDFTDFPNMEKVHTVPILQISRFMEKEKEVELFEISSRVTRNS